MNLSIALILLTAGFAGWLTVDVWKGRIATGCKEILEQLAVAGGVLSGPEISGRLTTTSPLFLYPSLRRLERDGMVTSWDGEPMAERGGRPRRIYRLTERGRRGVR